MGFAEQSPGAGILTPVEKIGPKKHQVDKVQSESFDKGRASPFRRTAHENLRVL